MVHLEISILAHFETILSAMLYQIGLTIAPIGVQGDVVVFDGVVKRNRGDHVLGLPRERSKKTVCPQDQSG